MVAAVGMVTVEIKMPVDRTVVSVPALANMTVVPSSLKTRAALGVKLDPVRETSVPAGPFVGESSRSGAVIVSVALAMITPSTPVVEVLVA